MERTAPETLPAALYRDPSRYETERHRIFARTWQFAGHESQLAEIGDYLALTLAGFPLIVVRGADDIIRAFHNVCRHRAGPLAPDGPGKCDGALVCRYHGWRYALDGRLAAARDFGPAAGFDPRAHGLFAVRCESWRGFLFVNIDADAAPLADSIAPLMERAKAVPLESFRPLRHATHDIRCNWKTYVENYLEGYHVPVVHPALYASIDTQHYDIQLRGEIVFHSASPREGAAVSGLWGWMWPCLGINGYANGWMMERMWPLDHARMRLDYLYFFPPDLPEGKLADAVSASEITTAEDIAIVEAVQRNLDAGIYERGHLSPKHEGAVALFQQHYARAMAR